jgi:hypothetical protein
MMNRENVQRLALKIVDAGFTVNIIKIDRWDNYGKNIN